MPKQNGNGKVRRSKSDVLTTAVAQGVADLATTDIVRQRTVIQCEIDAVEAELTELTGRIASARARRDKLMATFAGLSVAIGRRQIPS